MKISSLSKITGISPGGPPPRSARPDFTLTTTVHSGASTVFLFMKMVKTRVSKTWVSCHALTFNNFKGQDNIWVENWPGWDFFTLILWYEKIFCYSAHWKKCLIFSSIYPESIRNLFCFERKHYLYGLNFKYDELFYFSMNRNSEFDFEL